MTGSPLTSTWSTNCAATDSAPATACSGSAAFAGEFLILAGVYDVGWGWAVVGAGAIVLAAMYMLRLISAVLHRARGFDVTDDARQWLTATGYDPAYGARPLRRLIQSAIGDRLAKAILAGTVTDGGKVVVDRAEDGLELRLG